MQKTCKFGDYNQLKSGVILKEIESLIVDSGQIKKIKNQRPIWKRRSNQRSQIKVVFKGAIAKIKKFEGQLRVHMLELKQQRPNWSLRIPN